MNKTRQYAKEKVAARNEPPVNLETRFVPTDAYSHVDELCDEWLAGFEQRQMLLNEKMRGMKL